MRRWSKGALTAVIVAIVTATAVSSIPTRWEFGMRFSQQGVELSAATQGARIALSF
jgi:uncharacterized membrane protein YeaQ/YmgE (transglycosylase-associated protein family)